MMCTFQSVGTDPDETWTEDRLDLPLTADSTVTHGGKSYILTEDVVYTADWETSTMSASCSVVHAIDYPPAQSRVRG
jgi:hypothetical protein